MYQEEEYTAPNAKVNQCSPRPKKEKKTKTRDQYLSSLCLSHSLFSKSLSFGVSVLLCLESESEVDERHHNDSHHQTQFSQTTSA